MSWWAEIKSWRCSCATPERRVLYELWPGAQIEAMVKHVDRSVWEAMENIGTFRGNVATGFEIIKCMTQSKKLWKGRLGAP